MFPTANSTPYYNEDGEVLGWDTHYDDAPDPDDFYDYEDGPDPEDYEPVDPALCYHGNKDQVDLREGRPNLEEMPTEEAIIWRCIDCDEELPLSDEDWEYYYNPA